MPTRMRVTLSWAVDFQDPNMREWRIYASLDKTLKGELVATAEADARLKVFEMDEGEYHFTVVPVSMADVEDDWQQTSGKLVFFVTGRSPGTPSAPTTVAIQQVSPDGGARVQVDPLPAAEDGDRVEVIEGSDAETGKLVGEVLVPRAGATEAHPPHNSPIIPLDGSEEGGSTRTLSVRSVTQGGKASAVESKSVVLPERTQMESVLIAAVDTVGLTKTNFPTPTGSDFFTYVAADGFKTAALPVGTDTAGWALLGAGGGTRFSTMKLAPYPQFVKIESDEVDVGANVAFVLDCYDEVRRVTAVGMFPSRAGWALSLHPGAPSVDRDTAHGNELGPKWLFRVMNGQGKLTFPIRNVRWEYVIGTSSSVPHADGDYKPLVKGAWVKGRYVRVRLVIRDPIGWHQIKTGNIKVYARIPRVTRTSTTAPESATQGPPGSLAIDSRDGAVRTKKSGQGSTGWSDAMRPERSPGSWERWFDFENGVAGTPFVESVSGTSAAVASAALGSGDGNRIGFVGPGKGTDATGRAGALMAAALLRLSNGEAVFECDFYLPVLSTPSEDFIIRLGFLDTISADAVDGAYLIYDRATSLNWILGTASNSVRTAAASSLAVAAAAWLRLKIVVNAAGTSVEYFVNGTSIGTVTTNIPTASGRDTSVGFWIVGSAGSGNRTFLIDWVHLMLMLTTSR